MRNFSTSVSLSSSFAIGVDVGFSDDYFLNCQRALIVAMDANPDFLSPSQEQTLADFVGWFARAKIDDQSGVYPQMPVFFYANLNAGHNVVFVAVNAKDRAQLSHVDNNG